MGLLYMTSVVSPPLPEEHRCGRISGRIYKVHVNIQSSVGKTGYGCNKNVERLGTFTVYTAHVELLWFQTSSER